MDVKTNVMNDGVHGDEGVGLPQRKTLRAWWYDYAGGMYFVTFVTRGRVHYLGEIVDGEMRLSAVGAYVEGLLRELPTRRPYLDVVASVVMPDHVHVLLYIHEDRLPVPKRDVAVVNADDKRATDCQSWLGGCGVVVEG